MPNPFEYNADINSQIVPDFTTPELGFTDSLSIGADEAQDSLSFNIVQDLLLPGRTGQDLTEDEWKDSPYYREGLIYEQGMNWDWARAIAETHDRNKEFARLHHRMTLSGEIGAFTGGLGAGLIDPINLIALPAGFGVALTRATGSRILAAGLYGAATNAAVEVAIAPFRSEQADVLQTEYDFGTFATDVGASAALGGLFGAAGGTLARLLGRTATSADPAPTAPGNEQTGATATQDPGSNPVPTQEQAPELAQGTIAAEDLAAELGVTTTPDADAVARDVMDQIKNRKRTTPEYGPMIDAQTQQMDSWTIAKSVKAKLKGKDEEGKIAALVEAAQTLPRDVFADVLERKRSKKGDNFIPWKAINDTFARLAGNTTINRHLTARTIADAIWDNVNSSKPIDAYGLFNRQEPGDTVQVLATKDDADPFVGPDRYVVLDEQDGELVGSALGIAGAAEKLKQKLKGRGTPIVVRMTDGLNDSIEQVEMADLDSFLNRVREETGKARFDQIIDGTKQPFAANVTERVKDGHMETVARAWQEMKKMYGETDRAQLARQADAMVAKIRAPEDMDEVISGLREQAGDSVEIAEMLDRASDTSRDLAARREALREATFCVIGRDYT